MILTLMDLVNIEGNWTDLTVRLPHNSNMLKLLAQHSIVINVKIVYMYILVLKIEC